MGIGSERATHGWGKRVNPTASIFGGFVLSYLQRHYAGKPYAAKTLARLAHTSHRTCEKWLAGTSEPSGDNLMNLLVACEGLADELNELVVEQRKKQG